MRTRAVAVPLMLVAAACSGGAGETSTTLVVPTSSPPASTSTTIAPTTSAPSTTTSSTTPTVSGVAVGEPFVDVLVADDGLTLLSTSSAVDYVVGSVVRGVDDLQGGLIFQTYSGQWDHRSDRTNQPRDTIVWWLPAAAAVAQELLVPSGQQWLTIQDVVEIDGAVHVVYTRLEGNDPDTRRQTLRTFNLATRTVTEIAVVAGWESGIGPISGGDGGFGYEWFGEGLSGFTFLDDTGDFISVAGDPYGDSVCEGFLDEPPTCFQHLDLDPQTGRMAYVEVPLGGQGQEYVLAVVTLAGDEIVRWPLPLGTLPRGVDLRGDHVIVNRLLGDAFATLPALMVDLVSGEMVELEINGEARFLRVQPTTSTGVISPGLAAQNSWPMEDILLATDDGLSTVSTAGVATPLIVGGDIRAAVDDLLGGIVFQIGQAYVDNGRHDEVIYWLPSDGDRVIELITVAEGSLLLHDVALIDGEPTVIYVHDDEAFSFDNEQSLHLFQIETGVGVDLGFVAGWEGGTGQISGSPELIVYEWFAEIYSGFATTNAGGDSIEILGDPYGVDEDCIDGVRFDYKSEEERPGCPSHIAVSGDGSRIAYLLPAEGAEGFTDWTLVLSTPDGSIIGTAPVARSGSLYGVAGLEVAGERVIVNRTERTASDTVSSYPLMIDLATGEERILSQLGYARFIVRHPTPENVPAP